MLVMGIETSSMQGGVALLSEQGLLSEYLLNVKATHTERLLPSIDRVLSDAGIGLKQVKGLAVATGPGSFTGLRIGLSTVKGLAAATGTPVVGVPTLEAIAWTLPFCAHPICPILDARKGEVYCALFRHEDGQLIRVMEEAALAPEALIDRIREQTVFIGDGLTVYGDRLKAGLKELALVPPISQRGGRASAVADLGRRRLLQGHRDEISELAPRYLRASEAELKRRGARVQAAS
jgi:tRNA threonylcarbamoyladenosine biosynthesis protein TsaB